MAFSAASEAAIAKVAGMLEPDSRILFVTGAGLSADSGLPTYRGVGGLYDGRATPEGWPIEEVLSGPTLAARPDLTWKYLAEIGQAVRGATFNRGHAVLAEMERHFREVWVLTQNVDGFHRKAGSRNVVDIHGDMGRLVCIRRSCTWEGHTESFSFEELPPRCPECASVIRPDVVLFGERLPERHLRTLRERIVPGFDFVFAVGTSGLFPYVIEPVMLAHEEAIPTVEINPGATEISDLIDIKIAARAAEALDAIWTRHRARKSLD